jgi:DNA-binding transcriptional MerR regulator
MRIGELARLAEVSDKTIRYYEDIGVLDEPPRTASGYRDYSASALDRLSFVRAAQSVGITLGEIREIVGLRERGEVPCGHVVELIQRRAAEIDDRIAQLTKMRSDLRRLSRRARTLDAKDCRADKICHVIDNPGRARNKVRLPGSA